jgi:hypothetical protein
MRFFVQLGLNEADTLKSSSILIYYWSEQCLYTQNDWHDAVVNKCEIKNKKVKIINKVKMK